MNVSPTRRPSAFVPIAMSIAALVTWTYAHSHSTLAVSGILAARLVASIIGSLVETWCVEAGVDLSAYGSWTLKRKKAMRAVEPDECYVVGEVANPRRPDLAIEVVWTSGGIEKLEIYARLGLREVWFWRPQDGEHRLHGRRAVHCRQAWRR